MTEEQNDQDACDDAGSVSDTHGEGKYVPQNILLTGGAGFIGSCVAETLATKYPHYLIVVLDKLDYCSSQDNLSNVQTLKNFKFVRGDIRSKFLVDYLLRSENIDTILHFAASTHVDNSFQASVSFTTNNVVGTHVLLESAREYGKIKRFIHVSTDEVYGGDKDMMSSEESMLAPTNPYACTKAAAEFICRAYSISYGLPIIMTRGNNVYGPRQFPDKLIAKSAALLAAGQNAFVHGDGSHRRNYIYVTDCANAFDFILHKAEIGGVYNLGSPIEISNVNVVRQLVRLIRLDENATDEECDKHIEFVADRAFNDRRYRIDMSKLQQLGWQHQISWDEGLRKTAAW
eukprot:CAMPEP_0182444464 /NCGR_PEP_ID=MMETSP1172-20130603/2906_1 /TAXON_ID=708627 /ORGANISM="Timspurckia oligopyrenoides, Strain CCMP3278" /LENGTH=344 /DNA_ID=CAMNT_0024640021 /DNA_START=206 /DNA_END=1237 /DNA_ORIENTATION=+